MNEMTHFDTTTVLEKALPVIEEAHRILANNIANANTPGFVPTHVSFRESLMQALGAGQKRMALDTTHPRHLTAGAPRSALVFETDRYEPGRNDKSTFNVEREMAELLKNNERYNIISAMLTKRYQRMREVLRMQ
jgi:flagellar basal-body rod protein FlgB